MQAVQLSRLMHLSWEIQRKKKSSRSKSLIAAWAILANEDITVFYLVKRHSHSHYPNRIEPKDLSLFNTL